MSRGTEPAGLGGSSLGPGTLLHGSVLHVLVLADFILDPLREKLLVVCLESHFTREDLKPIGHFITGRNTCPLVSSHSAGMLTPSPVQSPLPPGAPGALGYSPVLAFVPGLLGASEHDRF